MSAYSAIRRSGWIVLLLHYVITLLDGSRPITADMAGI
jgi:hypothetical protein